MKAALALTLLATSFSFSAVATPVWKVESGNRQVYLGGTVHNLSESDYPLPQAFTDTLKKADEVYFEFDMGQANTPEFQTAVLSAMTYSEGHSIANDLSEDTLVHLKSSLTERGIAFEHVSHLKASLMGLTLSSIESQRIGAKGKGVDQYLYERALDEEKQIGWLESLDVQISTLASFGEGQEDEYIRYTLDSLKDKKQLILDMVEGWRTADVESLHTQLLSPMKSKFPDVYQVAVIDRNDAWLSKIETMFNDDDTEFVLVGVLHMVGEDSLLRKLQDKGYGVTKL